jgi:hypothetical protein
MENEEQNVPSAEASAPEPVTFDSALAQLNAADESPAEQTAAPETAEAEETGVQADQADTSDQEAATPDADTEADDYAHGNARTRLRDGTVTTVGELKKAAEQAKELQRQIQEREARDSEFEQRQAQIAAKEQVFTTTIQQAQAVLRANFPPKPDYTAVQRGDVDIITFNEQQAAWNHAVEKWNALEGARRKVEEEAKQKQDETTQQKIRQEMDVLTSRAPEFKDRDFAQSFRAETIKTATEHYGATEQQVLGVNEAWMALALKDALAYRKLQADKAKVAEKVKDVPPVQVQAPGRRASPAEKQAATVKTGFERLRSTGSFDDALNILNSLES